MLAINAKVYWRSGGTYASPTWTDASCIENFGINPSWDEGEANSRASRVKASAKTLLGLEFSGRYLKKPGNTSCEKFEDAAISDIVLDLLILDADLTTENARGWRVDCQVYPGNQDQALAGTLYQEVTFKPAISDNPPRAVKVTSSALTYTQPGGNSVVFA